MMEPDRRLADLSDRDRSELKAWVNEFDQRWVMGWLPEKASQIPPSSSWRLPALREMVKIDLDRQWKRGNRLSLESYLGQYPELGNAADVSADLIQAEYEVRKQHGEAVDLDEYARRFPEQVGELRRLIASGRSSLSTGPKSSSSWRGRPPVDAHRDLPEQFGRYRIIRRLGAGGMGSVYLAEDTRLTRKVALKVAHISGPESHLVLERFRREAMAAAGLDHPSLCKLYDVGEVDGVHYLTMEYVEGKNLGELISGRKDLSQRQVAAIVGKLAVAMQAAHDRGVVHRDLKPANVMIKKSAQKAPVIVDFGLAQTVTAGGMRLTQTGQALGTPYYMAVEQIKGELDAIGPACDIYALGVILYELLTGQVPFDGPNPMVVIAQILTVPARPPSEFRPDLNPRLEAICLKAMAKEIRDRYASMGELAEALNEFVKAPRVAKSPDRPSETAEASSTGSHRQGSDTLMGQFFDKLDIQAGATEILDLRPQARPKTVVKPSKDGQGSGRWPGWPVIAAFSPLPVAILGIVIYVLTRGDRPKVEVPDSKSKVVEADGKKLANIAAEPKIPAPVTTPPVEGWTSPSTGMKLALIPAGSFQMGSPKGDPDADDREKPRHPIRLTRPFYLGFHEVTRGQFRKVVEPIALKTAAETDGKGGWARNSEVKKIEQDPKFNWRTTGFEQTDNDPVVQVTWLDAVKYCNALSRQEGLTPFYRLGTGDKAPVGVPNWDGEGYRLPTEAEWEYACRAGTSTWFSFGDVAADLAEYGWAGEGTFGRTHPVGQKQPNLLGLFDMHGNVREWCWDGSDPGYYLDSPTIDPRGPVDVSQHVDRGGGWLLGARDARSAHRGRADADFRSHDLGLRVARNAEPKPAIVETKPATPEPTPATPEPKAVASVELKPDTVAPKAITKKSAATKKGATAFPKELVSPATNLRMNLIPAGPFLMGSPEEEQYAFPAERPQHPVRISRPFYLGVTELTQEQYRAVTGASPSLYQGDANLPVERVSWMDAVKLCNALSLKEKLPAFYAIDGPRVTVIDWTAPGYRLPTEAEWEYACRAGTLTRYSFGNDPAAVDDYGWNKMNTGVRTRPVGQKLPNPVGLFDMHGNVWEWCWDVYNQDYYASAPAIDPRGPDISGMRVRRGGSCALERLDSRSAFRERYDPNFQPSDVGIRLARNVPPKPTDPAESKVDPISSSLKSVVSPSSGMKLALLPGGTFPMGLPDSVKDAPIAEIPRHTVRLTRPFYIGVSEVTKGQFRKVAEPAGLVTKAERDGGGMGLSEKRTYDWVKNLSWRSPGFEQADDHPVVVICWTDAVSYCNALSLADGLAPYYRVDVDRDDTKVTLAEGNGEGYRLPTEAEWEYACRGGSTTLFSFGEDERTLGEYAWFDESRTSGTHPVARKRPNAFGLYDMHGNAWEWCWDGFDLDFYKNSPTNDPSVSPSLTTRVDRGGGWLADAPSNRSSFRNQLWVGYRANDLGFRVVRTQVDAGADLQARATDGTPKGPIPTYPAKILWDGPWRVIGDEVSIVRKGSHSAIELTKLVSLEDFTFEAEVRRVEGNGYIELHYGAMQYKTFGLDVVANRTRVFLRNWDRGKMTASPQPQLMGSVTFDQWDHLKVEKTGKVVVYYLNDEEVYREDDVSFANGRLTLATVNANARFRNIKATGAEGKVLVEGLPDLPKPQD